MSSAAVFRRLPSIDPALCAVMVAAFALRIAAVLFAGHGDAQEFHEIGWNLAHGNGFAIIAGHPTAFRAPLYPALVAGVYALFGYDDGRPTALLVIQALLTTALCGVVWAFARELFDRRVAIAAAAVAAVSPAMITYSNMWAQESLDAALLCLAAFLLWKAISARSSGDSVHLPLFLLAGAVMGLKTLNRPITLAFPAALAVGLLANRWSMRRSVLATVAFSIAMAAVIAPWTARNYIRFGRIIPVSADLGGTFLASEGWAGSSSLVPEKEIVRENGYRAIVVEAVDSDRRWLDLAAARLLEHPALYAKAVSRRVVKFWYGYSSLPSVLGRSIQPEIRTSNILSLGLWDLLLLRSLFLVPEYLTLVCAAIGAFLLRKSWRRLLPVWLPIVYFWAAYAAVHVTPRYKAPLAPVLAILAGYALMAGRAPRAPVMDTAR
jgi:4-amino-4-deoxy-L-arabinose transferase-like glycosyltransferase